MALGRDLDQCRGPDQHPVRRSSGEIPNYGLSLQHVHAQDAGQFQAGHCRIHDLLRIRALRQVGFSHGRSAFQPFRWPVMRNDSPTWVDFKIKLEGHFLVHLELRGYRSDQDMSVQINHVTDSILWLLQETAFIPTCVLTVFQGWRVCACSWEVGGRIYAISEGGIVVALDYPLCHMEIRLVATSSADAFGQDADRLEFRFYSAGDRLDVACSTCAAPPSWLIMSRVSGPTLIKNASWCRNHMATIEGPDQALQLSQLASIHAHWTAEMECRSEEDTGPRIFAIAVESNPNNLHLISECPLFRKQQAIVEKLGRSGCSST